MSRPSPHNKRLTKFNHQHAISLPLVRGKNYDTSQVVVIVGHLLLQLSSIAGGITQTEIHLGEETQNMISLRVGIGQDVKEDWQRFRFRKDRRVKY
jgi:hypothetical protein